MKRIEEISDNAVNLSKSTKDSNKFYSILLDARATTVSENTYDIAERLLRGETDNAKAALEHLWSLKKTMQQESGEATTIDMLIQYYQKKMDVVRTKEEFIKKISKDSRTLLEEKRMRDSEIATIKQEIGDCTAEVQELSAKLDKLKVKEQELTLIDTQLKKELLVNENEIINGLYEIILSQQEGENPVAAFTEKLASRAEEQIQDESAQEEPVQEKKQVKPSGAANDTAELSEDVAEPPQSDQLSAAQPPETVDQPFTGEEIDLEKAKTSVMNLDKIVSALDADLKSGADDLLTIYKEPTSPPEVPPPFPKSVVKTTKGRVIGEYFYDPKAFKNKRHYVFNSRFFLSQLSSGLGILRDRSDQTLFTEMLQMIQDAFKRISENQMMHFEISTSEILNEKTLKELWQNMKSRNYAEAGGFCKRLNAKIAAMKSNYHAMLKEQMARYAI
jgi:hypothetical protein